MNFFGSEPAGPSPLTQAKIEAEVLTDLFNKMVLSCSKKCVSTYHDGDLSVGEMACIDRCSGKYLEAQNVISGVLQKFEIQMKAQEAAGLANQVPKFGK